MYNYEQQQVNYNELHIYLMVPVLDIKIMGLYNVRTLHE